MRLHHYGRPVGPLVAAKQKGQQRLMVMPLDINAVVALLEAMDATQDDLEKVLFIEQTVYPKLNSN